MTNNFSIFLGQVLLQCFNCQQFGHMQSDCSKPRVCFKCGQQHENKQCTVDKPKCANCKGEHPSSSKTCIVTLFTLPLGLFAGFSWVCISTLACYGVHFSTNTFFIANNFSIFLGQVLLLEKMKDPKTKIEYLTELAVKI
jgi:hypothetical protein